MHLQQLLDVSVEAADLANAIGDGRNESLPSERLEERHGYSLLA